MDEASMHKGKAPEQIDELNWLLQQMHQVRDAEGQETGHSLQEIDIYIRILEKVLAKKATES